MIIKSTRIPTAHTSRIAAYLTEPADNEVSTWIRGCPEDLKLLGEISKIAGKQYSVQGVASHYWRSDIRGVMKRHGTSTAFAEYGGLSILTLASSGMALNASP